MNKLRTNLTLKQSSSNKDAAMQVSIPFAKKKKN